MIAIKKVQVVPLDYNEGKIIDSSSSTDDKTKNTYSMRIVDEKISEVNNSVTNLGNNVYVKDNFAVVTGTITMPEANSGSTTGYILLNYPTGFTKDNCVVISAMGQKNGSTIGFATTLQSGTLASNNGVGDLFVRLDTDNIRVSENKASDSQPAYDVNIKLLLLKYTS